MYIVIIIIITAYILFSWLGSALESRSLNRPSYGSVGLSNVDSLSLLEACSVLVNSGCLGMTCLKFAALIVQVGTPQL